MASTLSQRVNELFGAYVTMNATQQRLADEGRFAEVDHLTPISSELSSEICNIQDRSANADLLAARIMVELIVGHASLPEKADDWSLEERVFPLPMLEAVADATTGVVRDQARRILATIGVEVAPEASDPMLALVREYLVFHHAASVAETDDEADEIVQGEPMGRLFDRIANDPPAPTTIAGAAAAVRLVRDECNGAYNPALIRNVLAVVADALEGRAAS